LSHSLQVTDSALTFPPEEDGLVEALTLENQHLRAKESQLHRLLMAMTLLARQGP
jgi:hypothetical protein